jgi:hypothetical protein
VDGRPAGRHGLGGERYRLGGGGVVGFLSKNSRMAAWLTMDMIAGDGMEVRTGNCTVYKLDDVAGPSRRAEVIQTTWIGCAAVNGH